MRPIPRRHARPLRKPCEHMQAVIDLIEMGLVEARVEGGRVRLYPGVEA